MTEYDITATFPTKDNPTNQVHATVNGDTTAEALSVYFNQFSQIDIEIADNADIDIELEPAWTFNSHSRII